MSLILDALNRADIERKNQTPVPDLNTQHRPLALKTDANPHPWLWWGAGAAICVFITIGLWRWSVTEGAPAAPVIIPAPTGSTVPALINQSNEPVNGAQQVPVSQTVTSLTSAVTTKPEGQTMAALAVKNLYAEDALSDDTGSEAAVDADVSQLYAIEESTGSESVVDPFANLPAVQPSQPSADVAREPARTFENSIQIQDFNDLPWNTKQKMPTISYQRHDYLVGGISSVVINGQTVGVGNIIATGQFVVQDILMDGVVLKHGDRVFKLRALNGWINM